jgi:hypothetical protein
MGHVKMAGPDFVNDVTAWWPGFVKKNKFSVECFIISSNRTKVALQ